MEEMRGLPTGGCVLKRAAHISDIFVTNESLKNEWIRMVQKSWIVETTWMEKCANSIPWPPGFPIHLGQMVQVIPGPLHLWLLIHCPIPLINHSILVLRCRSDFTAFRHTPLRWNWSNAHHVWVLDLVQMVWWQISDQSAADDDDD